MTNEDRRRTPFRALAALLLIPLMSSPLLAADAGVREAGDAVRLSTGPVTVEVNRTTGALTRMEAFGRTVAGDGRLFLDLIQPQAAGYPARSNRVTGTRLAGKLSNVSCKTATAGEEMSLRVSGDMSWDKGRAPVQFTLSGRAGQPWIGLKIQLGANLPPECLVAQAGMTLPLALKGTTRVAEGGDRGIHWDTESEFQVFMDEKKALPAKPPDVYHWGLFGILQDAPNHYRMWKAESEKTSSLTMMQGKAAPGWMDLSDATGGVTLACRDFASRAPAELFADARNGGALTFYARPPHVGPLDGRPVAPGKANPEMQALSQPYDLVLWFHEGTWAASHPDREIAKLWKMDRFANDDPVAAYPEPQKRNIAPGTGPQDVYVTGGIPLPQGLIRDATQARLMDGAREVPLQSEVIAWWPDKSAKWILLTFPRDGKGLETKNGNGEGPVPVTIHVDTRLGSDRVFTLQAGPKVKRGEVVSPLKVTQEGGGVIVDTGVLRFRVTPGASGLLDEVSLNGQVITPAGGDERSFLEFLHTEKNPPPCASDLAGKTDRARAVVPPDGIVVEEAGPLRTTILIRGRYENAVPSDFVVRLQAYAGRGWVRVFHTWTLMGKDNRQDFLSGMGLRLPLTLGPDRRATAGGERGPVALRGARAGLSQPNYLSCETWQAGEGDFAAERTSLGEKSAEWFDLSDAARGCAVVMRNMWREGPKEIEADLRNPALTAWLWPASGDVLDTRCYSNSLHRASGESAWYRGEIPGEPYENKGARFSQGISKTHELLLYFHSGDAAAAQVESVAADFCDPSFVRATPEWYTQTQALGPIGPADFKRFPKIEKNMTDFLDFMLLHQDFWGWYGMLDYGDWGHGFGAQTHGFKPQNGWYYDFGRWGWTNTEGLPSRFLHLEFMRTGDRRYYLAGEAMARHDRDVDVYHAGPWQYRGTRHGVNHWSDGYKDERIAMSWPVRYDYLLRGDALSRDHIRALTDKRDLKPGRPNGDWIMSRPVDLLTMWEITGEDRYRDALKDLAHACIVPQGIGTSPTIEMPSGKAIAPAGQVNDRDMWFHYFGPMYAFIEYCDLTHDQEMIDALLRMWRSSSFLGTKGHAGPLPLYTFAARYEPDPELRKKAVDIIRSIMRPGGRADFIFTFTVYGLTPADRTTWLSPKPGWGFFVSDTMFYPNAAVYAIPFVEKEAGAK